MMPMNTSKQIVSPLFWIWSLKDTWTYNTYYYVNKTIKMTIGKRQNVITR